MPLQASKPSPEPSKPSPKPPSTYPLFPLESQPPRFPRQPRSKPSHPPKPSSLPKRKHPSSSSSSSHPTKNPKPTPLDPSYEEEDARLLAEALRESEREVVVVKHKEQMEQAQLETTIRLSMGHDDHIQERMNFALDITEDMFIMQASAHNDNGLADVGEAISREILDQLHRCMDERDS